MAKPAAGTQLDTGNALYSHLTASGSAVWAMLEGSGITSADSSGNGHTLTLNNAGSGVTWTTIGSDPALAFAGSTAQAAAVTSPPTFDGTGSWSFAWRGKQTTSDDSGMTVGSENNPALDYIWMRGANNLRFTAGGVANYNFSPTDFTADHDYLLVYDQPNAVVRMYKDGVEDVFSPQSVASNQGMMVFRSLGSGYDGAGSFSLVGTLTYAYLMAGYVATSTDANNLHTDPYAILASGNTYNETMTGGAYGIGSATVQAVYSPAPDGGTDGGGAGVTNNPTSSSSGPVIISGLYSLLIRG